MTQTTQEKYYCAGRACDNRDTCHRHTSSLGVQQASFNDYDLVMLRELPTPCRYFIDRNQAEGVYS